MLNIFNEIKDKIEERVLAWNLSISGLWYLGWGRVGGGGPETNVPRDTKDDYIRIL